MGCVNSKSQEKKKSTHTTNSGQPKVIKRKNSTRTPIYQYHFIPDYKDDS